MVDRSKQRREFFKTKFHDGWKKEVCNYLIRGHEYHEIILNLLHVKEGQSILECGIGTGEPLAVKLASKNVRITGVDVAYPLLEECKLNFKEKNLHVTCFQGDIEKLPFKDNSFDKVYCISTTWYLIEIERAIKEMLRVARQEVIFDIMNLFHISSLCGWVYNILRNSSLIQKIKISGNFFEYRSPLKIYRILKKIGISYDVRGFFILLPVWLPLFGDNADFCRYSKFFSYRLQNSYLKYFGSKIVYICKKIPKEGK